MRKDTTAVSRSKCNRSALNPKGIAQGNALRVQRASVALRS
ncbi:MAG: hypothetical protein VB125_04025 [Burkholderia sp.]